MDQSFSSDIDTYFIQYITRLVGQYNDTISLYTQSCELTTPKASNDSNTVISSLLSIEPTCINTMKNWTQHMAPPYSLHLGCHDVNICPRHGYIIIDVQRSVLTHIQGKISDLRCFKDNTVKDIYSSHTLGKYIHFLFLNNRLTVSLTCMTFYYLF